MDVFPKYSYTRQVIDEALRLYPPLWLMTRRALNDDRLGAYSVPAGTEMYISPHLIQRSPHFWEVPDQFDPDRLSSDNGPDRHELALCPFGAGPRKCIGDFFARVEIQMHLMLFGKELWLRSCDEGADLLERHGWNDPRRSFGGSPQRFLALIGMNVDRDAGTIRRTRMAVNGVALASTAL